MPATVGQPAPELALPGVDGCRGERRTYSLDEYRGRPVVVVFYPGDNTPVCTEQLTTYTREIAEFESVDAQVLAVSPQSVDSHEAFSCSQGGFAFPLLADEDKAAAARWGVLGPLGFYRRCAFVVDRDGVVRYVHRSVGSLDFRPTEELVTAVRAL